MKSLGKESLITAIINLIVLTIVIILAFSFLINQKPLIGPIMIFLGAISLLPAVIFKIPFKSLKTEIIFGIVDNAVIVIFALLGAAFFGVIGAVVGIAVGNSLVNGFAGIFKNIKAPLKEKRTILSITIGRFAGCLFGAGIILTLVWSILRIF